MAQSKKGTKTKVIEKDPAREKMKPDPGIDESGKPLHMTGVNIDITERKRNEEALRGSSERYRSYIEVTGQIGWTTNADGEVVEDLPFWRNYTGQTFDEIKGWGWSNAVHPDDVERTGQVWDKAVAARSPYEAEYRIRRHDGVYRHFMARGIPVFKEDGSIREWVGTCIDITERKQMEAVLRLRAMEMEAVLQAAPAYVWIAHDPDCLHITGNHAADELLRLPYGSEASLTAPEGKRPTHFKAFKDGRKLRDDEMPVQMAARGAAVRDFEFSVAFADGTMRHMLGNATPLFDEQGRPHGSVAAFVDVTRRKRAEEELNKSNIELNRRTAEIEAVNRELEAFSYTVSHDLKAPLRSIEGFTRALMEDYKDRLDETGRDYLNRVNTASQRMNQLIEAMLAMARLTRRDMNERKVNLSDAAGVIAHELWTRDPERKVKFSIAEGVTAKGDPEMLRIVLENLLENAWKFTGKHPKAKIEFGVTRIEGKEVYFVRDDGVGFEKEFADKLFHPFQRLHGVSEFPGIGIGLAISHRIIVRHGGRIWAEAEPEKGATFYFTLG